MTRPKISLPSVIFLAVMTALMPLSAAAELKLQKDSRVVLLGGGLGARMLHFGHF